MKIAITGLSGFLGHYVAKKLFERDVHIQALVRSTSNTSHLKDYENALLINSEGRYPRQTINRIKRIIDGCDFEFWFDVSGEKIESPKAIAEIGLSTPFSTLSTHMPPDSCIQLDPTTPALATS